MKIKQRRLFTRTAMKCLLIAVVMFFSIHARAEENADVIKLTIESATELAMKENPQVRIAQLEILAKEAKLYETQGNMLPSLSAGGMYTRNFLKQVIFLPEGSPFGNVIEIGSDNSYSFAFQAGMPLISPALWASVAAGKTDVRLSAEKERAARIQLYHDVRKSFLDALLARESYMVIYSSYENASENLKLIRKMSEQGMVSEYDLLRAEVQVENLKPQLLQAENMLRLSENFLKAMIGLSKEQKIETQGTINELALSAVEIMLAENQQVSLASNTELQQMALQLELLQAQKIALRNSNLPSINAFGNYQFMSQANDYKFSDYNWVKSSGAGLQLNIPIFSGFTNRNKVKQLEIGQNQLMLQKDYVAKTLDIQAENTLNSTLIAIEKTRGAERNVQMAERAYQISKISYQSGQGTLLQLNDSDLALTQARFNLLQSKYEILVSKLEFDKIQGKSN